MNVIFFVLRLMCHIKAKFGFLEENILHTEQLTFTTLKAVGN